MCIRLLTSFVAFLTLVLLTSCDDSTGSSQTAYPPPIVKTVIMRAEDMPLKMEYPGRLLPIKLAEVRARVTGIVLKRMFVEGTDVKAGDVLFQIDPARFKAALDIAKAQLARAESALALAFQQEERAKDLLQKNVGSKDQYDVASASRKQNEAEVAVARANLQTADLELSYATVRSPIDGRIGGALVTEGAFVRQEDGTHMATVRDLSSVYADFTAPLSNLARVQQEIAQGALGRIEANGAIELITNDGATFGQTGRLLFSSSVVNETTAQVSLRAEFANSSQALLPGTYVRVRMTQGMAVQALLVPQRAVQWDMLGQAKVMTVVDGKAVPQPIRTSHSFGNRWLVSEGLKQGDQVIVDGGEKALPGSPVTAQSVTETLGANAELEIGCIATCEKQPKL